MKIYAKFRESGLISGFYPSDIYPEPPAGCVEITEAQWQDLLDHPGVRRWDGAQVVPYDPPAPPVTQEDYARAIQARLDATARERQYDSIQAAVSYLGDPNPTYAAEAAALRDWRSAVWTYALAQLALVAAGDRAPPTVTDLLAELPTIVWPA
jgi:hypothetical protein